MHRPALRLSTRLGITHGVLVALLLILLAVTLQGLLRMLGLITTTDLLGERPMRSRVWQLTAHVWPNTKGACRRALAICSNWSAKRISSVTWPAMR